jgi:hypothetical protein
MKSEHPIALLLALITSAGILGHGLYGLATGSYKLDPGTFTYDANDAGVTPFSEPANAETENR